METTSHSRRDELAQLRDRLARTVEYAGSRWLRDAALECIAELDRALVDREPSVVDAARAVVRAQSILAILFT